MGRFSVGKLVAAVAVAGLALGAVSAEARNLETILKDKTIKLGTIPYPPVTTKDPKTNDWAGFWVDGPKLMFEAAGLKVEFVETKWATFPSGLQSDQFDVFVGGAFNTPRRAAAVSFSRPVMYMGHSVTIRKEDAGKFKSLSDIDKPGVTVATVLGTSGHEYMKQNFKNATIKPLDTGDLTQDSLEVLAGRADAALQDAFKVAQVVGRNKEKLVDLFMPSDSGTAPPAAPAAPAPPPPTEPKRSRTRSFDAPLYSRPRRADASEIAAASDASEGELVRLPDGRLALVEQPPNEGGAGADSRSTGATEHIIILRKPKSG